MSIDEIVAELIDQLYELPNGATASTLSLLRDCGFKEEDYMPVIMEIHRALFEAADAENIRLEFRRRGRRLEGPVYEAELRVTHGKPEEPTFESEFKQFMSIEEEEEKKISPLASPVFLFNRYMELIFANDELWEQFQMYVRAVEPNREEDFFAYHRDPACMAIWRQMLENMGGGFPITLFASAAFLILAFKYQGHDLNMELMKAYEKLNG